MSNFPDKIKLLQSSGDIGDNNGPDPMPINAGAFKQTAHTCRHVAVTTQSHRPPDSSDAHAEELCRGCKAWRML